MTFLYYFNILREKGTSSNH